MSSEGTRKEYLVTDLSNLLRELAIEARKALPGDVEPAVIRCRGVWPKSTEKTL